MPNPLTGEYDVVVEAGLGTVNRVLAAQHAATYPAPTYLHSVETEIDVDGGGAAGVHGTAQAQVSTPSIALPADPTRSRVTVRARLMARFTPTEGEEPLPEPLHGDLSVTVPIRQRDVGGEQVVEIDFRAGADVRFAPVRGAEIAAGSLRRMEGALGRYLARTVGLVNETIALSGDAAGLAPRHVAFRTIPGPSPDHVRGAISLLLSFGERAPGDAARLAAMERLIAGSEAFAVAVSAEMLDATLRRAISESGIGEQTVNVGFDLPFVGRVEATYRIALDPASFRVRLDEPVRRAILSFSGRATSDDRLPIFGEPLPTLTFAVTQGLRLVIAGGSLDVFADGPPAVTVQTMARGFVTGLLAGAIEAAIERLVPARVEAARDEALSRARSTLRAVTDADRVLGGLLRDLRIPGARVSYSAVQVRRDALVLRGVLGLNPPPPVRATFESQPTPGGLELNALESWVPAGTIRRYQWLRPDPTTIVTPVIVEEHRFVTTVRPAPAEPTAWCVLVDGDRADGPVTGRSDPVCRLGGPTMPLPDEVAYRLGDQSLAFLVRGTLPDPPDWLLAHIDPVRAGLAVPRAAVPMLVHLLDGQADLSLGALRALADEVATKDAGLTIVVVVPPGAATKVEPLELRGRLAVAYAEDYEGRWAEMFDLQGSGSRLIAADGELAWKADGVLDLDAARAALDPHLTPGVSPTWAFAPPGVQIGEAAPDFSVEYAPGQPIALRKLRGRDVVLAFWTAWSEAATAELKTLAGRLANASDTPTVLAVSDGDDPEHAATVFTGLGLPFTFVADPKSMIARSYGVSCWPTLVSVDREGIVVGIHQGRTPEAAPPAENGVPK